jgi:hypothetical protein
MELSEAEQVLRDHLRHRNGDATDTFTIEAKAHEEGWIFFVSPAHLYFGRAMSHTTVPLFVDAVDSHVHVIPTYGLRIFLAKLRGRL